MNDNEIGTIYDRTKLVLGDDGVEKLKKKHIIICGIGGVGSYVLEACARIGINNITVVDKDVVDVTNINRQLLALNSTINMPKVEVAKNRVLDINKEAHIKAVKDNITKENIAQILKQENISYVIDAVDNFEAKISIIKYCKEKNIKCISCMGMGNRINPLEIKVDDIFNTSVCPLAKKVRKELKSIGISKQKVVYSTEVPKKNNSTNTIGSVSFVPSVAGLIIASEVVKGLLNE